MPFYEYECSHCKFYVETLQKISDEPLKQCPSCKKQTLKKLISAPVFRLKGDGWYETDFKSEGEDKRNLADRDEPAEKSEDKTSSDTKAETKAEVPAKKKAESKPEVRTAAAAKKAPVKAAPAKGKKPAAKAPARRPPPKKAAPAKKKAKRR
ncbi:zinc ribbon domain-containing protein [Steroidobacter sp. S1-65]|uniref:Zinc ribbon domain-containing protein n=1 Tax=Steroidobacter gossypii TaxID=2805490 RepID=A0ABS1WR31_9GAMM|nr:zinc ribbon domain-containing protein [Steroidobacter gossypii]MBM0103436.1 zinc ribbon domain-containing protein [Steroidobacter gossypii]